jgi:hypothetical protein
MQGIFYSVNLVLKNGLTQREKKNPPFFPYKTIRKGCKKIGASPESNISNLSPSV